MYVEIYGLSGSGKTTLAEEYSKKHKNVKYQRRPKNFFELNFFVVLQTLKQLRKINSFLRYAKLKKINFKKQKKAIFISYYCYNLSKFNKKMIFFGHGFIQTLTQNSELRQKLIHNKRLLIKAMEMLPKSDSLYIYLQTNLNIAKKRARERDSQIHSDRHYKEDNLLFNRIDKFIKKKIILNGNQNLKNVLQDISKKLVDGNGLKIVIKNI